MTAATSSTTQVLGRYRPLLKLGQGGMADVYLAVSRAAGGFERLAVIKRLRPDLLVDDEENAQDSEQFIAMFRDEARLAILLQHENIVHTYDVVEENGTLFLVMEYLEGHSLNLLQRELVKAHQSMPHDLAARIVADVLAGLHYAHELRDYGGEKLNIVHRDVSPQNVLIGYAGTVKLVDFGVAKASFRSTQTRAGTMKGKARYMSPEQVVNKGVDRRADVYSAGVLLWELLANRKLIEGANMFEQLVNVLKTPPPLLSSIVEDLDTELENIVQKALEREPDNRFETAAAMRDALLGYIARVGGGKPHDLGELVSTLFASQREKVASVIRTRMAQTAALPTDDVVSGHRPLGDGATFGDFDTGNLRDLPVNSMINSSSFSGSGSGSGSGSRPLGRRSIPVPTLASNLPSNFPLVAGPVSTPSPSINEPHSPPRPTEDAPKKRTGFLILLGAGLLVGAGALIGVTLSKRGAASDTHPTAEPAHTTVPASTAAAAAPPAAPADPNAGGTPVSATVAAVTTTLPAAQTNAVASPPKVEPARAPAGAVAPAAPRPAVVYTPPPPKAAAPARDEPAPAPAPAAAAASEPGFLTLDTYPWTKVSIDGRAVGSTPIVRFSLAPGAHTIVMENPGEGVRESTSVVIKSGDTVSKRLAFDAKN